jgi:hypothetical protein
MARKPLTQLNPEVVVRLTADAEGRDIVGLQPGEAFDPIGDLDRRAALYSKRYAVSVPADATLDQVIDAVVELAPSYGFDRAGTRGFLDGAMSTVDPTKGQALRRAALEHAAARLGYAIEVKS